MSFTIPYEENVERSAVWLRGFFFGPTGGGKSKGALRLARAMFGGQLPITLINSEKGRGKLYADRIPLAGYIALDEVGDFSPQAWIAALDIAEKRNPGGVYVLDSVSHEWMGKNGVLQQADRFGDWKTVRPLHQDFVERLLACEAHVIVCCRAKMKYEVTEEDVPGRSRPRQVVLPLGVGPIQDGDLQYEFNLVGQFEQRTHEVTFSGHVDPLVDSVHDLDDDDDLTGVAAALERWLSEGNPIEAPPTADDAAVAALDALAVKVGTDPAAFEAAKTNARRKNRGQLHPDWVQAQTERLTAAIAEREATAHAAVGERLLDMTVAAEVADGEAQATLA